MLALNHATEPDGLGDAMQIYAGCSAISIGHRAGSVQDSEGSLKKIAALAIRMVRHEIEYSRQIHLNSCKAINVDGITTQWEKLVESRKRLEREVKALTKAKPLR